MRQSVLSQKKTEILQKTSDSLGKLRVDKANLGDAPETILEGVPCIWYPTTFQDKSVLALLDSGSEVNTIHPTFAKELGLPIRSIDVGAQKIDGTTLDTYRMVVTAFLMTDKANRVKVFERPF